MTQEPDNTDLWNGKTMTITEVTPSATEETQAFAVALRKAGNKNYSIRALKDHNHLSQVSKTGGLSEYRQVETTVSSETLDIIAVWVSKL